MTSRRSYKVGVVSVPKEAVEQENLFAWFELIRVPVMRKNLTEEWIALSSLAFAVPNGQMIAGNDAQRARYMAALKRQGLKPGVSDIVLPYPTVAYHGLFIEMKRIKGSSISQEQKDWRVLMERLDYRAEIVNGFDAARVLVLDYIGERRRTVSRPSSGGLVI